LPSPPASPTVSPASVDLIDSDYDVFVHALKREMVVADELAVEASDADGEAALRVLEKAMLVLLAADVEVDDIDTRCDCFDRTRRDQSFLAVKAAATAVDVEAIQDVVAARVQPRHQLHMPSELAAAAHGHRVRRRDEDHISLDALALQNRASES
jgi:hypothetical protein